MIYAAISCIASVLCVLSAVLSWRYWRKTRIHNSFINDLSYRLHRIEHPEDFK